MIRDNLVIVSLDMAYSQGNQEVYRIPTVIKDIVEIRLNIWECGCRDKAIAISGVNGEMLIPIRFMKDGMAMFSVAENFEFISVTAVKKDRVIIEKNSFVKQIDSENAEKFIVIYTRKIIYKGKWTSKTRRSYPKYKDVVEVAIERSRMRTNPQTSLYANF